MLQGRARIDVRVELGLFGFTRQIERGLKKAAALFANPCTQVHTRYMVPNALLAIIPERKTTWDTNQTPEYRGLDSRKTTALLWAEENSSTSRSTGIDCYTQLWQARSWYA